jgi:cytochrome c-type biogenesis protein
VRGIGTSLAVTAGLIAVFGAVGLAVNLGLGAIHDVLPIAIVILGATLATLGVVIWRRGDIPGLHLAIVTPHRDHTVRAIVGFGAAYGVAALSCALPVFLISVGAVGNASLAHRLLGTAGFTAGMASVLALITVTATFAENLATRLVALRRHMPRVSAVLLIAAGAWTIYSELPLTALDLGVGQPTQLTRAAIAAAVLAAVILTARVAAGAAGVLASLTSLKGSTK